MKKIAILVSVLLPCLFTLSCNKEKGKEENKPAELSVVLSDVKDIYEVPKNQSISVNLMVVPDPVSAEAYTINLAANPGLVASYNEAKGTSYQMLPSTAYTLASSSVMLTRYSPKSTACELRLSGNGCEIDKVYVLPISIDGVQGGTNFTAPDEKAAYILFKMLKAEQLGSGTESDPYLVDGMESFFKISGLLKDDASNYFKLTADLDFSEVKFTEENPWTPINKATSGLAEGEKDPAQSRKIYFEGDNHKISNFKADGPLFGEFVGCVQNLVIENAAIDAAANDAAIVAAHAGSDPSSTEVVAKNIIISKSSIISDYKRAGALFGWLKGGIVENCIGECSVHAQQQVGGLIGRVEGGSIINSSASGKVTSESYYSGGLIGIVSSPSADAISTVTITGCNASGDVEHVSGSYSRAGGLIGQTECNLVLEKCYATGNVDGSGHYGGGLVGYIGCVKDASDQHIPQTTSISQCYATGNVTLPITNNFAHAGGLVGTVTDKATVNINNCYATGTIVVRRYSSGFVGTLSNANAKLTVTNSYTTSNINGINLTTHCGLALGNNSATATAGASYTGFVAWNKDLDEAHNRFCYPEENNIVVAGNYFGNEGTVSSQASKLGWDTSIWDLSKDLPTLK